MFKVAAGIYYKSWWIFLGTYFGRLSPHYTLSGSTGSTGSGTAFTGDNVPAYVQFRWCQVN